MKEQKIYGVGELIRIYIDTKSILSQSLRMLFNPSLRRKLEINLESVEKALDEINIDITNIKE